MHMIIDFGIPDKLSDVRENVRCENIKKTCDKLCYVDKCLCIVCLYVDLPICHDIVKNNIFFCFSLVFVFLKGKAGMKKNNLLICLSANQYLMWDINLLCLILDVHEMIFTK